MNPAGALQGAALLTSLPDQATVRETARLLTYEQAVHVASTILDDVKAGRLQRPYSYGVRHSLRVCAEVFAREAGF